MCKWGLLAVVTVLETCNNILYFFSPICSTFNNDDLISQLDTKSPKTKLCICDFWPKGKETLMKGFSLPLTMKEVKQSVLIILVYVL